MSSSPTGIPMENFDQPRRRTTYPASTLSSEQEDSPHHGSSAKEPPPTVDPSAHDGASIFGFARRYTRIENADPVELEKLVISRSLFILSVFSVVLILINFLQVGLLQKIDDRTWINLPPALVVVLGAATLSFYLHQEGRWRVVWDAWNSNHRDRRSALVGIILTMILVVFSCQFVYMNVVAVPRARTIIWNTSLGYKNQAVPPAILVYNFPDRINATNLPTPWNFHEPVSKGQARFAKPYSGSCIVFDDFGGSRNCDDSMAWFQTSAHADDIKFHAFDPGLTDLKLLPKESIEIDFPFIYSSWNITRESYFYFLFVDPQFLDRAQNHADNMTRSYCGLFTPQILPALGTNYISVERQEIDDQSSALTNRSGPCPNSYATYSTALTHFRITDPSSCDVSSKEYESSPNICRSSTRISFKTNMVTKQASDKNIDPYKILTDEGGIAGGIMFFTWFLGIFVI